MPEIRPFRGLRYRLEAVGAIDAVLAPPYDVIAEEERRRLLERSPYNIVRLTLGDQPVGTPAEERDYTSAGKVLDEWRSSGVLEYDARPCLYVYEQVYQAPPPRNDLIRRRGIIAALRLEPFGRGVLPHEGTLNEPKRDRLRLFSQTLCSCSQIFGIYTDPERVVEEALRPHLGEPEWTYHDEAGTRHRLWVVSHGPAIAAARRALLKRPMVIADGHHRYETALAFRDMMREKYGIQRDAPWEYVTVFLCNTVHRSLTILPAHRMIRRLPAGVLERFELEASRFFDLLYVTVSARRGGAERAVRELLQLMGRNPDEHVFGAYWGRSYALAMRLRDKERALTAFAPALSVAQRNLDVALLHSIVIRGILDEREDLARASGRGNIYFERDPVRCFADVDEGEAVMALLCNPTRVEDVIRVAMARERMPQKGTYFWPKPPAGLVLYDMRPDAPTLKNPTGADIRE